MEWRIPRTQRYIFKVENTDTRGEIYGEKDVDFITYGPNGAFVETRQIEWGLNTGWYLLLLATVLLVPLLSFGIMMKNHKRNAMANECVKPQSIVEKTVNKIEVPAPLPISVERIFSNLHGKQI